MIAKPEGDSREYKAIKLDNQMSVLLISEPSAENSAAAIDVHVGSLSDPAELQGLAHFCEHLLFMGTKTYPDEAEYSRFLAENGGKSNAFTMGERTNYYFDIQADHFEPALDRFSKFFIEPLFLDSCILRELQAVDSEHKKNINNDTWAGYQLLKDSADPNHSFSKFSTGNLTTLKHDPESKGCLYNN
jgi:insulysin